ncbi:ATP-binding cassette sub-family G member [Echinococcus granulosus]|uniref:ATP-binding cassette sub-family G member n=1 Tax=Echinococcus granulosus TaxID=6210 RepID=W6UC59_ECHGR|nr:ATP-binding cassette sub-family G member [Echinococcus granulosus]EUB58785.1 ATP-binding cassette sub-family G member [Echinococcus granulosus]
MLRILPTPSEITEKTPSGVQNLAELENVNNHSENSHFHSVPDSLNRSPDKYNSNSFQKSIEFKDLVYAIFQGRGLQPKFLLKSVSGNFKSGELVAIMGPSGAGKSTLMNVLAGFKTRNVSGQILVNGKPRHLASFRRSSCFIMQDAPLLSQLTVEEAMTCSSQLNLPQNCPNDQRKLIIDEILQTLGLSETRNIITSDLSGGQRKRLSIAQEMINNPPIMFFDEPTSGLDSNASLQCIVALQTIAKQGRTVVCTIHQPSATIFDIFDQLYFLRAGQCLYRGPVKFLVPYLASLGLQCPRYHNPSDFLMDLAFTEEDQATASSILLSAVNNGRLEKEIVRLQALGASSFLESLSATVKVSVEGANVYGIANGDETGMEIPSTSVEQKDQSIFRKTIRILTKRTLICIWRDKTLTRLRLLAHVVVGILIGLLYFNVGNNGSQVGNNAAFIFFSTLFIMFSSLMPTVMTFPLEMRVFLTEHLNYWYSVRAYYFAKTLADLPFQAIIYGMIGYFMTDQPLEFNRFMIFLTMLVLTAFVAQAQGLLIGASTDLEVSVFLGPATGIPIILFSGFFITLDTIPKYLQWLSYSSFTRYAFEGSMKGIYGNNRSELNCSKKPTSILVFPCMADPQSVLTLLSVSHYHYGIDITVLIVFFFALRVLGFFVLKWRARNSTRVSALSSSSSHSLIPPFPTISIRYLQKLFSLLLFVLTIQSLLLHLFLTLPYIGIHSFTNN